MKTNFMKVSTWAMALCASMAVFTACNYTASRSEC